MIQFSKSEYKPGYSYIDMHFHTKYSDGTASIKQVLKKLKELSIGVAITDHNEIQGCTELYDRSKDLIIPGIEVKSREMVDILFYFYNIDDLRIFFNREILPHKKKLLYLSKTNIPLTKLLDLSKKYKCLASVAHPFGYLFRTTFRNIFRKYEKTLSQFDVFEAINGGNFRAHNQEAIDYIYQNNKGYTAGSDGHSIQTLGRILTFSKSDSVKSFLNNIKNKKNSVAGVEVKMGKLGMYLNYTISKFKNGT